MSVPRVDVGSFAPVARLLADQGCPAGGCLTIGCDRAIANVLGVTRRQVQRYRHEGVSERQADRIAARLGMHPGDVWGWDEWDRPSLR